MSFLLDTMVVSYFLQATRHEELASACARQPCAIADRVDAELAANRNRGRFFAKWRESTRLKVLPVLVGSTADTVLGKLDAERVTSKGSGERSSIALAASDQELTFVTMDKGGIWIALRELWSPGERVIGLPVFLRRLVEGSALALDAAIDVLEVSQHSKPTWWMDWVDEWRTTRTHSSMPEV